MRHLAGRSSLVLGIVLGVAAPARALSPRGPCTLVTPQLGRRVPANAPALIVASTTSYTNVAPLGAAGLRLAIDGVALPEASAMLDPRSPAARGLWLVRPPAPVSPGLHELSYYDPCALEEMSYPFWVDAEAPLPSTLGTHTVSRRLVRRCPPTGEVLEHVDFKVTVSAEVIPFLAVTMLEMSVDGRWYSGWPYGLPPGPEQGLTAIGICRREPKSFDYLAPGEHEAVISAHVAGANTDPVPLLIPFEITCAGLDAPPTAVELAACETTRIAPPRDAGVRPADAAGAGGPDASASRADAGPASESDSGCGCAVGGTARAPRVWLALLLAAAAVTVRARRRGSG